jgi:Flp pilus assembly protein TadD
MAWKTFRLLLLALLALPFAAKAEDAHIRIPLPSRGDATPVQKLNQQAVAELRKHNFQKARSLLYRAYLIDQNDPFTLNNLGYVSELTGDLERAHQYYDLAANHTTDAVVAKSTVKQVEGQPISRVVAGMGDRDMQVNRINMEALRFLAHDRPQEADILLTRALAMDPKNPFTLNNFGFAKENEGELEAAERYYQQAADLHSEQPVLVTTRKDWRGKPVSNVARNNAKEVRQLIRKEKDVKVQVARYNLRGVSAINRNDRATAYKFFLQAYKLDPYDAFTLNNMGYVAELDGDRETAQDFYRRAQRADHRSDRVTYSSRLDMQGRKMVDVAEVNDSSIESRIEQLANERRRRGGAPILLKHRDNTPVTEPEAPPAAAPAEQAPPASALPTETAPPANEPPSTLPADKNPPQ